MILTLVRNIPESTKDYTIGELYVQEEDKLTQTYKVCDTLEDAFRLLPKTCPNTPKGSNCECKEKVYGKTCIPNGTYTVVLSYSNRFKRILPELLNVPHFLGIRIHSGNSSKDTEGCLLLGENKKVGMVLNSKATIAKFCPIIKDACAKGKVTIEIK